MTVYSILSILKHCGGFDVEAVLGRIYKAVGVWMLDAELRRRRRCRSIYGRSSLHFFLLCVGFTPQAKVKIFRGRLDTQLRQQSQLRPRVGVPEPADFGAALPLTHPSSCIRYTATVTAEVREVDLKTTLADSQSLEQPSKGA